MQNTEPIDLDANHFEHAELARARQLEEDEAHRARAEDAGVTPLREVTTWEEVALAPILAGEIQPPQPSMFRRTDGAALLYPGKTHAFLGEFESGKTWAALAASAETIRAGEHVLYIDFEDDENTFVLRLRQLGVSDSDIRDRAHYIRPERPLEQDRKKERPAVKALVEVGDRHRPALVVLDGVTEAYALHELNPNKLDDVARFLDLMPRRWDRTGAAVILIDHVVKSRDDRGKYAIGSQHKMAGVNGAAYRFDADALSPGRAGAVKVTVAKDRPGQVRKFAGKGKEVGAMHLRPAPDRGPDDLDITVEAPTYAGSLGVDQALVDRVVEFVAANPSSSTRKVRESEGGDKDEVAKALQTATSAGRIRNAGTATKHAWEPA